MTAMIVAAALLAAGLVRLYRLALPTPPDLARETARWDQARQRAGRRATEPVEPQTGLLGKAAGWLAEQLRERRGVDMAGFERDLAIKGATADAADDGAPDVLTLERWLSKTLALALTGLMVGFASVPVLAALGLGVPLSLAPVAGVLLGLLMIALSVNDLRTEARRLREDFRGALSIDLDLVVMSMEAGRGHQEALPAAAGICTGWAFTQLQDAIDGAQVGGITPWEALGRLGERYGIAELVELRSTLAIANDEGGRIRATLIARAQTIRESRLADAQARANKATDAMRTNLLLMAMVGAVYIIAPRLLYLVSSA